MLTMKIKCPVCREEVVWQGNPFRPFCSERCSLIDLGKWADEKYSVKDKEATHPSSQEGNKEEKHGE